MKKIFLILLIILPLLISLFLSSCQEGSVFPYDPTVPRKNPSNRGFPSKSGTWWVYQTRHYENIGVTIDTLTVVVTGTKIFKSGDTAVVYHYEYKHRTDTLGNPLILDYYYQISGDTIYLLKQPAVNSTSERNDKSIFLVFPLQVSKGWEPKKSLVIGPSYKDTAYVESMVNVDVPFGTFYDEYLIRTYGLYSGGYHTVYIYDPQIGIISQIDYESFGFYSNVQRKFDLMDYQIK